MEDSKISKFDKKLNSMSIKQLEKMLENIIAEENEIKKEIDVSLNDLT